MRRSARGKWEHVKSVRAEILVFPLDVHYEHQHSVHVKEWRISIWSSNVAAIRHCSYSGVSPSPAHRASSLIHRTHVLIDSCVLLCLSAKSWFSSLDRPFTVHR